MCHREDKYPITVLCDVMQVKRSSYYNWKNNRSQKVISADEFALRSEMKRLFKQSRESLGSRRMSKALRAQGFNVG